MLNLKWCLLVSCYELVRHHSSAIPDIVGTGTGTGTATHWLVYVRSLGGRGGRVVYHFLVANNEYARIGSQ